MRVKNGNYSHSYRFVDADGKIKWLHDEQRLLYNKDNQPAEIIGSVLDVTNLKENEQKLIELNATKDKFFSIIAHDLKSPISGILNLTGLMAQEFNKLSIEQLLDISTKLYKSSISFNKLLENLLLWSRLSRGGIEFDPQYVEINKLIENTLHLLDNSIKTKEINVINKLNGSAKAFVDENMIETVLRNLISNAVKFTPKKGEIEISAFEIENGMIEITIRDSGIGIKAENIDKLFGIDTKYSTRGTEGESGTGLGLIICKEFIDKHEGNIYIISSPDKGTKVKFSLPMKKKSQL